ncbi:flagellar hook-basal body complex protein [Gemmobacter sp.]|uniref:flagellar hook protein FlgE n=1 Tax=Gemmobacter sp. TaxID=1898957 RepID=UPI002B00068F|nr:flagellar hook-basal body complex protein [Gemmobacter sp.]
MTISSSLNAGVAGLNANAARLATISDNIANSATYGYKRNTVDFHSMVVGGTNPAKYTAGGVRTTALRLIDERGPLVRTDNATDLSVDGRGFLPVTSLASLTGDGAATGMQLMTTGSFRPDANGYLTTADGQVLLGWPVAADGSIGTQTREALTGLEPIKLNMNQFTANPTTAIGLSVNLPATATEAGATGQVQEVAMQYYDNLGMSRTLTFTFTPTVPATGASNSWSLSVHDSASDAVIGEYEMTFENSQTGGGLLSAITTVSGGAYDPATGAMELTLPSGPISLTIGKPGQLDGMTQLSSSFSPGTQTKNGSPVASMVSVEFDADGNLYGVYDQGFTRKLYQVPVADVRNPNGLTATGGQTYEVSMESGGFYLWDAGDGPTGAMSPYTREESATDVATELTQLIQTQRAYSSNAKVIQTVDEMLQETTNLKR